ncbi:MAG: hypothetical protein PUJ01_12890 [Parabacteroides sp.]|nr:hypothetical protein [Parabacteroides sp.]
MERIALVSDIHSNMFVNIMGNGEAMFFDEEIMKRYESEAAHRDWVIAKLGQKSNT